MDVCQTNKQMTSQDNNCPLLLSFFLSAGVIISRDVQNKSSLSPWAFQNGRDGNKGLFTIDAYKDSQDAIDTGHRAAVQDALRLSWVTLSVVRRPLCPSKKPPASITKVSVAVCP